jgi:nucleoside-diphosphate-sugar epimerase
VTGGAGFIGSHITDRLLESGFDVTVIDDLSSGCLENISAHTDKRGFVFVRGDIRSLETVKKVVKNVNVVFHEAALVGVTESLKKPMLVNDINVNGTLNLLEASLKAGVERFVLASSAAVYGDPKTVPIKEDSVVVPESPYAVSKLVTELYAKTYFRVYGLETVCLRYFNVYGPRQASGPYAAVITAFVDDLIRNRRPTIYGDGEQTRDFVNIKDVVQANVLAMEKDCAGEVFSVATGSSVTINHLLEIIKRAMDKNEIEPKHAAQRPHDIRESCGDVSRASKILGFKPEVSLEDGLRDFVKYQQSTAHLS